MGEAAEEMARRNEIPREAQDAFAVRSHKNAAAALEAGKTGGDLVPVETPGGKWVHGDTLVRATTSVEQLAKLRPVFAKDGTLTAGNSTPLTDGAAACLVASDEWARAQGLTPQCWIRDAHVAAVDFVHGEGLLMAPTIAVAEMLRRNGLTLQDFDVYEIHEAFAAVATTRAPVAANGCPVASDEPFGLIFAGSIAPSGASRPRRVRQ